MAALDWLASHAGPDDVVIAPLEMGQFVPNYGRTRAFLAHWAMTDRFFQRRDETERFFSAAATDTFRQHVLDRDAVTLVLDTPGDAQGPRADLHASSLVEPVFVRPRATIFRYRQARAMEAAPSARR
jgi:hypothetical protein